MSWFVTGGTRRLDLPGGEWIEVKDVLTWGEQRQLDYAAIRAQVALERGEPQLSLDLKRHALMRMLLYLVDWSLRLPDGRPAPIDEATLEKLHPAKARLIEEALDRHVAAMQGEPDQDQGQPGSQGQGMACPPAKAGPAEHGPRAEGRGADPSSALTAPASAGGEAVGWN